MKKVKRGKRVIASSLVVASLLVPTNVLADIYRTKENLNLRTGPSTSYGRILTIPKNSNLTFHGKEGNWFNVSYNNKKGYVSSDYVTVIKDNQPSGSGGSSSGGKVYTTTNNLNLRTGPSTSNGIVLTIPKGGKVSYISQSGNWFKVSYNGRTGFVSSDYLRAEATSTPTQPAPAPSPGANEGKVYTTTNNLNLRTGPSTSNGIVLTIPKGREVSYISSSNGWYKVKYGNYTGYVSADYIKITEVAPKPEAPKPEVPKPETPKPVEPEIEEPEVEEPEVEEPEAGEPEAGEPEVGEPEAGEPEVEEPEIEKPGIGITKPVIKVNTEGYMTTENLNLRSGIGTNNSILATIPRNTKVTVFRYEKGWYQVRYGGRTGYVSGEYIKKPNVTRNDIVDAALALVNRVPYFWGGKSSQVGWNNLWNTPVLVTAAGSSTTGKVLPFGLDCSGFIDWAFRTAGVGNIFSTGGTYYQWQNTYAINKADLKPGDLAFKQNPNTAGVNHVGIYVGKNEKGENLFVHSAYSQNGVVVTTETEYREFKEWRRPYINY